MTIRMRAGATLSRRSFLSSAAAATAATVADSITKPSISHAADRPQITHGIQSGDVSLDSGIVWARADRPARMLVEVATTESFRDVHQAAYVDVLPETDCTGKVLLEGLPAGQDIFYRIRFQNLSSPTIFGEPQVGRFRTAPGDRRPLSFVWSGDTAGGGWGIDLSRGGMRCYATMHAERPDFFIHCGDSIYADTPIASQPTLPSGEIWRNIVTEEKSKVAETLAEFRGNYKYNLLDPNVRAFNAEVPIFAQWDDHEVTDDWLPGATIRSDEYREKSVLNLVARGCRAFHEFMPLRQTQAEAGRIYRKIPYGPHLDVFMLDMRSYRGWNKDELEQYGPDAYLLGPVQTGLAQARADALQCDLEGDRGRSADRPVQSRCHRAGQRSPARPRDRDRAAPVVHQACRHRQHGLDHRRHALHRGALLRPQQGGVPGFRAVLGICVRSVACRHLSSRHTRQHVRTAGGL